jgi:flagellar hook-length control protein FliK
MIAANLDVQDLNTIKTALKNGEAIPEELMVAAFTMAMPPQTSRKDAILLPRGNVATGGANNALGDLATPAQIASQQKSMDDLAASLNSLIVDSGYKGGNDFDIGFDDILRVFEQAQTKGGTENALLAQNLKNNAQAANAPSALNSAVQNLPLPMNGMNGMSDSFSMDSIFPEGFDFASLSSSGGQSLNAQIAQMTSMVSHVQQAGYPHPATQHVAVNIAKAAQNGDTDITIRLDPPDLGRVQIKMMIAADKKVQAVMLIEKPETFLMLQRDAQMLEKALQDAGLDVSGDSLNFELAQDGNLFDHDQKDQNGNSGAGGGKGGESAESEDLDIIETTMDWYVDPQTGLTRYNLLV